MQIPTSYPIIVHSHLRWDWVWQRPQQFLSRLSKRHRILFVEGPQHLEGIETPQVTLHHPAEFPNITIMQSVLPQARYSDGAWVDAERYRLVKEVLNGPLAHKFDHPVQWFYDPMATVAFAGKMNETAIVYDCMDELSQFKGAPAELINRERFLLSLADVVFTGGRKMYESKSRYNRNCHFYGCGVDVQHFGKARASQTVVPADIADLPKPVLGYFGVVDERMDYELLAKLAEANPQWSIVMVGPRCKVEESELPQRPNIHWLGGRNYADLPAYAKGFDMCMMPFALNAATEYINPTKALEYMATGKPIVSSAVPDVVSNFSQVVKVASGHEEFIALCQAAIAQLDQVAVERGQKMAEANTWDAIVAKLEKHIADVFTSKSALRDRDEAVAQAKLA
ncbi:MAG: glycosyltransferase [Armatimonadota bacterium]|nr:glycosyltransferase [Armatimonadota bacterium]